MSDALLLTAYEKYGSVSIKDYTEMFIDEHLNVTEDMISDYNEYLSENGYETYESDFEEMLNGMSITDAVRCTFFGDFRFAADYHKFNGYGNLDSFDTYQVINEMKEDKDFLRWYVEQNDLIDEDEAEETVEKANELIRKGF